MEILKGIPVSPGFYIGQAFILESEKISIPRRFVMPEDFDKEIDRFQRAKEAVIVTLSQIRDRISSQVGVPSAAIFDAHIMLLQESKLADDIIGRIKNHHYTAEYAVSRTLKALAQKFKAVSSEYLAERSNDILDLEVRMLKELSGSQMLTLKSLDKPVALIAADLSPSVTADMVKSNVKAFATDFGGKTSHTAILARAFSIPAIVGLETISKTASNGDSVIIDGNRGFVFINPDDATRERYEKLGKLYRAYSDTLIKEKDIPTVTRDSVPVNVMGNIELPEEAETCLENGADGVGLYRTEFLFLRSHILPTEEDHFRAYCDSLKRLKGRPLTIRTFDLGADKIIPEMSQHERNPVLGSRSIRASIQRPEVFVTQLRAIFRASTLGPVKLMLPMITTLGELLWARRQIEIVKEQLYKNNIPFDDEVPLGIMVEVPAAALCADLLAPYCDFFSIGTNDLIQYTMAVDRTNEQVAELFNPSHQAVLRLIKIILDAAKETDTPVSMCGEMAGEIGYNFLLLGMGLRSFSVSPTSIPEVKRMIRHITIADAEQTAREIGSMSRSKEITNYLNRIVRQLLPYEQFA